MYILNLSLLFFDPESSADIVLSTPAASNPILNIPTLPHDHSGMPGRVVGTIHVKVESGSATSLAEPMDCTPCPGSVKSEELVNPEQTAPSGILNVPSLESQEMCPDPCSPSFHVNPGQPVSEDPDPDLDDVMQEPVTDPETEISESHRARTQGCGVGEGPVGGNTPVGQSEVPQITSRKISASNDIKPEDDDDDDMSLPPFNCRQVSRPTISDDVMTDIIEKTTVRRVQLCNGTMELSDHGTSLSPDTGVRYDDMSPSHQPSVTDSVRQTLPSAMAPSSQTQRFTSVSPMSSTEQCRNACVNNEDVTEDEVMEHDDAPQSASLSGNVGCGSS